ncbi:jg10154 [Pararge aegeria aegeria]|uniref:Jg10154 protein n=1 Tax=Pararge aegeria aegeria TaxID=348720 RepID=A0A8S4R7H4_9NEOP|nr:jg10154 [Pararge aegeria aegeria]
MLRESNPRPRLRKQVCCPLRQLAVHSSSLDELCYKKLDYYYKKVNLRYQPEVRKLMVCLEKQLARNLASSIRSSGTSRLNSFSPCTKLKFNQLDALDSVDRRARRLIGDLAN